MIEFQLPTMTCGHCVRTVTEAVKSVDAAAQLEVDLPSHRVRIESTHPRDEFATALTEEGYAPAPLR
jgi:copper chaperone